MESGSGGGGRGPASFFEDFSKIAGGALGAAGGLKADIEALARTQASRLIQEFDLVRRDEFEAVRDMAANARAENDRLRASLDALEARIAEIESKSVNRNGSE